MKENSLPKNEISKIKLTNGEVCAIKDALLRHQINILLGIEESNEND